MKRAQESHASATAILSAHGDKILKEILEGLVLIR